MISLSKSGGDRSQRQCADPGCSEEWVPDKQGEIRIVVRHRPSWTFRQPFRLRGRGWSVRHFRAMINLFFVI